MPSTLFPFARLFGDVVLSLHELRIDGTRAPEVHIDADARGISIYNIQKNDWHEADIELEVEAPLQELRSRDVDDTAVSAVVRLNCDSTNVRAVDVARLKNGKAKVTLTLRRELVNARATIECYIVADGSDGVARILKEAAPWSILFDAPRVRETIPGRRRGRLREFVEVKWIDFSGGSLGYLQQWSREAYYLDLTGAAPVLYLNSALAHYQTLLSERRGASRAEQAVRDLEFRRLALGVWLGLAQYSLSGLVIDEELGELIYPDGWSNAVLERLLPRLFPGESFDVAARKVVSMKSDSSGAASLQGRVQIAVNELIETSSTLAKHLAALSATE